MSYDDIMDRIRAIIPDPKTFINNIRKHIQNEYFPLIYQCLYERIMPKGRQKFSTEGFKKLLNSGYLRLLNDIYRTRLSNGSFSNILERIEEIKSLKDYEQALEIFKACNPRKNYGAVNAYSFGTKVLHTFNPEENPILDSVVRKKLRINNEMSIQLCVNFKTAINHFADNNKNYFSEENFKMLKEEFTVAKLNPIFPKMKLMDMALYQNSNWGK